MCNSAYQYIISLIEQKKDEKTTIRLSKNHSKQLLDYRKIIANRFYVKGVNEKYHYKVKILFMTVAIFLINCFCGYVVAQQDESILSKKIFQRVLLKKGTIVKIPETCLVYEKQDSSSIKK